jgi:hypothetical protein
VPFVAITLLAGLQTVPSSLYEAATIDGATPWQIFRHVTYPLLTPIIAVVMTFSVLFTFTDFQLIWVLTRGGPANATHLMATLGYQRAIGGGYLGEGSAIATAMIPFLLAAILISWFGLQRRKWQHGGVMTDAVSFGLDAERCRGLGVLPSPLWGGVGGGGRSVGHQSCFTAPPPSPPLPHKGGGSRPSLLRAITPERVGRRSND